MSEEINLYNYSEMNYANVNKILYNMFWSQGIFDRILDYCNNSVVSVIQQNEWVIRWSI